MSVFGQFERILRFRFQFSDPQTSKLMEFRGKTGLKGQLGMEVFLHLQIKFQSSTNN